MISKSFLSIQRSIILYQIWQMLTSKLLNLCHLELIIIQFYPFLFSRPMAFNFLWSSGSGDLITRFVTHFHNFLIYRMEKWEHLKTLNDSNSFLYIAQDKKVQQPIIMQQPTPLPATVAIQHACMYLTYSTPISS